MEAPFGSWGTQTFIGGLSAYALIAPWVIKGAMDGEAFAAYVEQVLVAELEPDTVVILHNLATQECFCRQSPAPSRMQILVLVAIQTRPESEIDGVLKTQSSPAQDRCPDFHGHVPSPLRHL